MITTLLAVVALSSQVADQAKAAPIVSKMFARYAGARTLSGTIKTTAVCKYGAPTIDTKIQYERPSKLFLWQRANLNTPLLGVITSDGLTFSYDNPSPERTSHVRLVEAVKHGGVDQTVAEIFTAGATAMPDDTAPVRIAIARVEHLKYLKNQWATLELKGREAIDGIQTNHIVGDYRVDPASPVSGTFEMFITDDGDLMRFVMHTLIAPAANGTAIEPFPLDTTWECRLEVNGKIDPSLFRVLK